MKIKALLCVVCCLLLITTACGTTKTKSENQSDKKAFENIANKDESAVELKKSQTKIEYIEEQMEMKNQGYVEGGFNATSVKKVFDISSGDYFEYKVIRDADGATNNFILLLECDYVTDEFTGQKTTVPSSSRIFIFGNPLSQYSAGPSFDDIVVNYTDGDAVLKDITIEDGYYVYKASQGEDNTFTCYVKKIGTLDLSNYPYYPIDSTR